MMNSMRGGEHPGGILPVQDRTADGYAVQLVYRDSEGEGHIVGNDDVMLFLSSYHPTVAPPGTGLLPMGAFRHFQGLRHHH